jgi:hypothetical protein
VIPGGREGDYNTGTTASGIAWEDKRTVAWLFLEEAQKVYGGE